MAYYTRYEKLQKCHSDGTPYEPAEYKKGEKLGVAEYSSIEECQGQPGPGPEPVNYTCCIKWEAYNDLNFSFNNNYITTAENPWCTKEKVRELNFHKSQSHIESLDITVDETNSITSMYLAFGQMGYLRSVKLNMPKAASLSDISSMFEDSIDLTSINFINFDTSHVTTANYVFSGCHNLRTLDVSNWNTSNLKSAAFMFADCRLLTSLDLNNWDTSNLQDASEMFHSCHNLRTLDVSNWNVSNVTTLEYTFAFCHSLTSLDLSNWNTSNCQNFNFIFCGSENLETLNLKNFDMSRAISYKVMFRECNKLKNIICKQAFKDWCITHQDEIELPTAMREGGTGTWTIVN